MDKFGWGFIGSGGITRRVLKDFPLMNGAYLASVYSPTFDNARKLADEHGARAYETLKDAVADPNVRAVYVATTNNAHKAHALAALQLGKAVLCEKPFALSREEAEEMMSEAARQGCFLMEAMWTRFNPTVGKALQWVREGRIGRVKSVQATFAFQVPKVAARVAQNAFGGGSLLDLGVYPLSLAQFVFGDAMPTEIHAKADMTPERVDSQCVLDLHFPDGATAHMFSSVETHADNDAVIRGEHGTITLPNFVWARRAELVTANDSEAFAMEGEPRDGYHYEFNAVMQDIRAGRTENALVTHTHTLRVLDIMDNARAEIGLQFE